MDWTKEKVLVSGGGGFLGRAIIRKLIALNCAEIVSLGRNPQPELEKLGVRTVSCDIRDFGPLSELCESRTVVFHTAALAGIWGRHKDYHEINVVGTKNLIKASIKKDVPVFVYTSTPSVAYSPLENVENADENLPYPEKYLAIYPETKAFAEKTVLAANGKDFFTVALRPHLIWGPGDPHLLPRIIDRARQGRLVQVGDGENLVDITYVDNAASAHISAAETLRTSQNKIPSASGKAYFISDAAPVKLWPWINSLLKELGINPMRRKVSYNTAYAMGTVFEIVYKTLFLRSEPPMTRFLAGQLAFSHYFNISAAREELGYNPEVSPEEALRRTIEKLNT